MSTPKAPPSAAVQSRRLGEKLRALRESRGWTQEEVAKAAGYRHHSAYTKLETGAAPRPTAARVLTLARIFGVSTDVLLKDEEDLPART